MRILAILLFALMAADAVAQSTPAFVCSECRDLSAYPIDAANFALNNVFGPDAGAVIPENWRGGFDVVDMYGNQVFVDINASYDEGIFIPIIRRRLFFFVSIPDFNFSGNLTIQAIVKDAYGKILENVKLKFKEIAFPLPVGRIHDGGTPTPANGSNNSGGGGSAPPYDPVYWREYAKANCRADMSQPNETTIICKSRR